MSVKFFQFLYSFGIANYLSYILLYQQVTSAEDLAIAEKNVKALQAQAIPQRKLGFGVTAQQQQDIIQRNIALENYKAEQQQIIDRAKIKLQEQQAVEQQLASVRQEKADYEAGVKLGLKGKPAFGLNKAGREGYINARRATPTANYKAFLDQEQKLMDEIKGKQEKITITEFQPDIIITPPIKDYAVKQTATSEFLKGVSSARDYQKQYVDSIKESFKSLGKGLAGTSLEVYEASNIKGIGDSLFNNKGIKSNLPPKEIEKLKNKISTAEERTGAKVALGFVGAQFTPAAPLVDAYFVGSGIKKAFETDIRDPKQAAELTLAIAPLGGSKLLRETKLTKGEYKFGTIEAPAETSSAAIKNSANPILTKRFEFQRPRAAVILKDTEGKILVVKDKDSGQFLLPGGARNKGESFSQAAAREVSEELGLSIKASELKYQGKIGALSNEVSVVFEYKLPTEFKLKTGSDVASTKFIEPSTIKYYKPTERFPFGAPQTKVERITGLFNQGGGTTRTDTAFIIDKFVNKRALTNVDLPVLVPPGINTRLLISSFTREGKDYFVQRVQKPSIRRPLSSTIDLLKGRKPGQIRSVATKEINIGGMLGNAVKQDISLLGSISRYDVGKEPAIKFSQSDQAIKIASGTPKAPTSGKNAEFIVQGGNPRGEQGLFFQPSLYVGGPRYIGISYLRLGSSKTEGFTFQLPKRALLFGEEKAPLSPLRSVAKDQTTFTKKGELGKELEVIYRPDTKFEYVSEKIKPEGLGFRGGGEYTARLFNKRIGVSFVKLSKQPVLSDKPSLSEKSKVSDKLLADSYDLPKKYVNPFGLKLSSFNQKKESNSSKEVSPLTRSIGLSLPGKRFYSFQPYIRPPSSKGFGYSPPPSSGKFPPYSPPAKTFEFPPYSPPPTSVKFPPYSPPPSPQKSPPPILPPTRKQYDNRKESNQQRSQGFLTLVRRGGKFRSIGRTDDINKAASLGIERTKRTLARTFRILPLDNSKITIPGLPGYRAPKRKGRLDLPLTFVQRSKFSLSSFGEKREIQLSKQKTFKADVLR